MTTLDKQVEYELWTLTSMQLFRGLNIRVVLKESITWTNGDQITVTGDAGTLLTNFRGYQPRITTDHDSAMLLTWVTNPNPNPKCEHKHKCKHKNIDI